MLSSMIRGATKRTATVCCATAIATTALIAGCGGGPSSVGADGQPLKVYRHSMDGAPVNIDPVQSAVIYSNFLTLNLYDTLYTYKYLARPYELKPNLAVGMPTVSDDGLTHTIKIKSGTRYMDDPAFEGGKGRVVTAQDFVYSIKRHFDPDNRSQGSWLWTGKIVGLDDWGRNGADYSKTVEGLQALDDTTIQVKLTKPFPQLPYTFAMGFSGIVPVEAVDEYGESLGTKAVGSGPYILQRFSTAKAVLVPNPNYRQEPLVLADEGYEPALHAQYGLAALDGQSPPFVDRLEIDFIEQTAARWASFTSDKEVQYTNVPVEQVDTVLASKNPVTLKPEWSDRYFSTSGPEAGFVYTYMNMDGVLGDDGDDAQDAKNKALRCAIRDAFDWSQRNEVFYSGIGLIFPGVITPVMPEYDPSISMETVTRDLAGAKKMLADAGWTADTLPTVVYGISPGVTNKQIFDQFRGFMQELGYPMNKIDGKSFATFGDFNRAIKNSQLDIGGLGWGLDYPDAENTLQLFYGPYETPGSNNANYKNPAYDALYEESAVMQPGPERTAIYRRMNDMLLDDCTAMMGLSRNRIYLWHKNVIGLPDREILGGFWLKYVDVATPAAEGS